MTNTNKPVFEPIAVVGASALFPQSIGGQSFWSNILGGADTLSDVPEDHWLIDDYYDPEPAKKGKIYGKRGAFLPQIDFDPMKFGMPPNQLSTTDTAQLLGLIVASKVIDDAASIQFGKVSKSDISVILGVASATEMVGQMASRIQRPHWVKALRDAGIAESKVEEVCDGIEATYPEWDESTFPGLLGNVVAGRIANRLDLGGTNCVIDAACASSLGAVSMAIQELQLGHSDLVITGGVDAINDTFMYMCFSQTPALSATGDCRPFSADADGTMLGEGIGMVALRRLEDAERDGDKIYAVIKGLGSSSDGRSGSIYAPESSGQALAIRRAYETAGYGADEVSLIEAHGTATKAGDAAEFGGLMQAFEGASEKTQWCALGSVKSQIGHTKSAAGSASLFKVVMSLHHKVLPPTIKVSEPNPTLEIEKSPFYLNTETRPWIHDPASTRKASVSSFGFGGSNFHVTLEEYNKPIESRNRYHNSPAELMLFSGASADEVTAAAKASLAALDETMLSALARKLQSEFDSTQQYRLSVLVEDNDSAKERIEQAVEKINDSSAEPFSLPNCIHYGIGSEKPKLGYLFPGQGSQYVNMGADLACEFDEARRAWDTASTIELDSEQRLDQVVFPIPVFSKEDSAAQTDLLTSTQWAQPAIGCASLSMLNLLDTLAVKPDAVAGHSYGEVSALHAAGVLSSAESLLKVSRRRGELMFQAASVPGSMTAVRASRQEVQGYLDQIDCKVTIANINSPTQVVIAGETTEIEKAEPQLKELGCSFRRLPVATAFHTDVVSASAEPFHEFLSEIDIDEATVPVYSNTTASLYPTDPAEVRKTLAWQLARPVQFQESIEKMHDDGIRLFVEVGPGSVLAGMVKDCLKDRDCTIVSLDNRKSDGRASFWNALGVLASAGIPLDFDALWENFGDVEASQEITSHSPVTVKLNGSNYGKPYPPENGSAGVPKPNPETPAHQPMAQPVQGQPISTVASGQAAPIAAAVEQAQSAASVAPARDANWVTAFQSLQQQTLDAQKAFQDTLTDAHKAFLHASEVAFAQLGGDASPAVQKAAVSVPAVSPVPVESKVSIESKVPVEAAVPLTTAAPVPVSTPGPETVAAAPAVAAAPTIDFEAMLLDVVADKTGYPKEMLTLDMELESGLGIDSIKRVEILSSLQEQLPHLDEMDTGALAELNTLGEIITFASASAPVASQAASTAAPDSAAESVSATSSIDFEAMLLDVVAEKTGYPKEMLTLDMELESGLGIDSIKRVEILSSLQEQLPHLGELDTAELAELNTLGEIIDLASASGTPAAGAPAAAPVAMGVDFEAMLLDVVAEKTGYPKDMLTLDMELESGLGIDSIKRVEILSSLQEQLPHLGELDTAELAELNTLGEIIDLASGSAPAGVPAATSPAVSAPAAAMDIDFEAMLLDVVAEKTGYPKEMLTLDMELESGLGIDSIKRVEILSALQDQLPHVGEMDTTELAELNTLGEIISFVSVTDSSNPAAVTTETVPGIAELARYEVGTEDREATGVALGKIYQADPLYLAGDRSGIAAQLSDLLAQAGVQAQVVDTVPEDARWVVLLTGLNSTGEGPDLDISHIDLNRESFQQVRNCALNMSERGQLLVTVQSTGGDFGLSGTCGDAAWAGGISSLAKTAAQEWPDVAVKAIDIDTSAFSGESLANALFKEITAGGPELEVGLQAGGKRISPVSNKIVGQEQQGSFPEDSVLVVSGGARGVTADCLKELAGRHTSKIAILGRTPLREEAKGLADMKTDAELKKALLNQYQADGVSITPIELNREVSGILNLREVRQNLQQLEESGSMVTYIPTDISDRDSVEKAVAQVRETFGPITGVVHAAGVLADKEIHLKTDEQFQSVFKTKVHGLYNLLSATRADPLTHLVCFSSVAARTGNRGQVDYAMANEILNLVCHAETAQRGEGFLAKSIGWGPWAGGMVDPSLARHFESMGVALIPPADGAALFADEITGLNGDGRQIVYGGNLDNWGESKKIAPIAIRVHKSQHQLITSHEIQDQPVVPLAMVSEWCLRIATAFYPKAYIAEVSGLKVLKGIQLKTFAGIGDWLDVVCEEIGADHLNMMVKNPDGTPYYQMSISLTKTEAASEPYVQEEKSLPPWKLATDRIYKDLLFHGKDLQVVKKLLGSSDTDCMGLLQMPDEFDLSSWRVAMVDGGLQLALLWERHRSGLPSLPTGFGNLHWHTSDKTDEPITCELVLQSATKLAATWSMVFANAKQEIIATMDDVIIHVLPGGSSGAA
jgi:malonyl CoA-acyl carrier protein transacylase